MSVEFDALKIPQNATMGDLARAVLRTGISQTLAATGTVVGDAAVVVYQHTRVSAADGAKGVILPAKSAGANYIITNTANAILKVYPPTGGAIDGGSANASINVAAYSTKVFLYATSTVLGSVDTSSVAITGPLQAGEVSFTETSGSGVYTGSVTVPAGASILDVLVNGVALWDNAGTATLKVGDVADDDGYFTGVNLKTTDLLAGESLSFALAGGKAGAYIANSQVSPRYSATARVVSGIITTSSTGGTAGRTRMTVIWTNNTAVAATKV